MAEPTQEFVNKYIERQQRAIADLMNKVVLLETQLIIAEGRILELSKPKVDDGYNASEIKVTEDTPAEE